MPVSKDTTTHKQDTDFSVLFPSVLIGKKFLRTNSSNNLINNEHARFLENYLRFKDPQEFVNAIKSNNVLLGMFLIKTYKPKENIPFTSKETLQEADNTVDSIKVVYETLTWWIQLHHWEEKSESDIAKNFLSKIAPVLMLEREEVIETHVKDGLIHKNMKIKNTKPSLNYESPEKFMERWNQVYEAFQKSRSKKRYSSFDRDTRIEDASKAISTLGNQLYNDEIGLLDLKDVRTTTASYIRAVHENLCPICNKKQLSDSTIINLVKKAKLELNQNK